MDFAWNTYYVFGVWRFYQLSLKRGQTFHHLVLSSLVGLWCLSAQSFRSRCCDFNELKIIKNGVWMLKLWSFCFQLFIPLSRAGDSGLGGPESPAQNLFFPFLSRVLDRNLWVPLPGWRLCQARESGPKFEMSAYYWEHIKSCSWFSYPIYVNLAILLHINSSNNLICAILMNLLC
jgi:hypothetical protein